ncbi:MAG: glycosyltransferase, partial [Clostridia bacterium]|nr:glycosyltransferase [Clostridia bacterium]
MSKQLISVIVPCYNEAEALPYFFEELAKTVSAMDSFDFEEIYVDDGSSDQTLPVLREHAAGSANARY